MRDDTASSWRGAQELADALVNAGGGHVRCVLLYGSYLYGTSPNRYSAFDFIVLVDDYHGFYTALSNSSGLRRSAGLMSAMAYILPPNVIAYAEPGEGDRLAKCNVINRGHLERALGLRPKDHYLLGRSVQELGLVWSASDEERSWVESVLARAREGVLTWMSPYLTEPVDALGLGQRMLQVCYQGELRPEAADRYRRTFEAQADHFVQVLGPVLSEAERSGVMIAEEGKYQLARPPSKGVKLRWKYHFMWSKVRAAVRALKNTLTFDEWLSYIVRKAERHSGKTIRLTWPERRFPLVFLWPRMIMFLLSRPEKDLRQ